MDHPAGAAQLGAIGERWVIRRRLPDGSATDVVGWLTATDPDHVQLVDRQGQPVEVDRAAIIAARRVPVAFGGPDPRRTRADELARVSALAWVADYEFLGDWVLRAADGFTRRANSCLVVGDPGRPFAAAVQHVVDFADRRGIRPRVSALEGSAEERAYQSRGWRADSGPTEVLAARLSTVLGEEAPDPRVTVAEEPSAGWQAAYRQSRPGTANHAVVQRVLTSTPPVGFAAVGGPDRPVAIGRGQITGSWLGITALWTEPEHRRRGWSARVVDALAGWAARRGARSVYLQVAADNEPAMAAYLRRGFEPHHRYRYFVP